MVRSIASLFTLWLFQAGAASSPHSKAIFNTEDNVGVIGGLRNSIRFLTHFFVGGNSEPPPPPEPTTLKVFAAGFGRTGTASLALALTRLGYKPLHGPDVFSMVNELEQVHSGRMTARDLLNMVADQGFNATGLDVLNCFWREALQLPDVKLILTVHDSAEQWAESYQGSVGPHFSALQSRPFSFLKVFQQFTPHLQRMVEDITDGKIENHPWDTKALVDGYSKHVQEVLTTVPEDRLLMYNVKEGWAPLCRFLEVAQCPEIPFPSSNDKRAMQVVTFFFVTANWIWPVVPLLALLVCWGCLKLVGARPKAKIS